VFWENPLIKHRVNYPRQRTGLNWALNSLGQKTEASAGQTFFKGVVPMNYQAFTNETLKMMHQGARGALAVDDEMVKLGDEPRFKVRDTLNWTMHVSELETEMVWRGLNFEKIDWSTPTGEHIPSTQGTGAVDGPTHLSARIAAVMRIRQR
jgi:hypothetical protein